MKLFNEDTECPICFEEYSCDDGILKDGPSNHCYPTECPHYFCVSCCNELAINCENNCPICRRDIKPFLESMFEDISDSDSDDDFK